MFGREQKQYKARRGSQNKQLGRDVVPSLGDIAVPPLWHHKKCRLTQQRVYFVPSERRKGWTFSVISSKRHCQRILIKSVFVQCGTFEKYFHYLSVLWDDKTSLRTTWLPRSHKKFGGKKVLKVSVFMLNSLVFRLLCLLIITIFASFMSFAGMSTLYFPFASERKIKK